MEQPVIVAPALSVRQMRWTYERYQQLADAGFVFRRRVELLGGRIIEMAPQLDRHAVSVGKAQRATEKSFGPQFWARPQFPLHLDGWSAPEPDIAVVAGAPDDYVGTGHPKIALLVIEISETTLRYDRRNKGPRYARAGYPDYWIINLVDSCLEVYRNPVQDPSAHLGWRYSEVTVLTAPASITPLSASTPILVADLLPLPPVPKTPTS